MSGVIYINTAAYDVLGKRTIDAYLVDARIEKAANYKRTVDESLTDTQIEKGTKPKRTVDAYLVDSAIEKAGNAN